MFPKKKIRKIPQIQCSLQSLQLSELETVTSKVRVRIALFPHLFLQPTISFSRQGNPWETDVLLK